MSEEEIKRAVIHAFKNIKENNEESIALEKKISRSQRTKNIQIATGNNIIQAGNDINNVTIKNTNKKINVVIPPPAGSIGANALLAERIKGMFNELGLRREERYEKNAYSVVRSNFKKDFSIPKNQNYTTYLLWPEARAEEIILYLQEKLNNTIKGRNQKAFARKGHRPPYLLGETNKLHKMLGWSDAEFRAHLHYLFGVTTRSELTIEQLENYVAYLRSKIDG